MRLSAYFGNASLQRSEKRQVLPRFGTLQVQLQKSGIILKDGKPQHDSDKALGDIFLIDKEIEQFLPSLPNPESNYDLKGLGENAKIEEVKDRHLVCNGFNPSTPPIYEQANRKGPPDIVKIDPFLLDFNKGETPPIFKEAERNGKRPFARISQYSFFEIILKGYKNLQARDNAEKGLMNYLKTKFPGIKMRWLPSTEP